MKYVIAKYLRISDEDVDLDGIEKQESNSIGSQRNLLDDYISRISDFDGCEVIEIIDDGRTGTNFLRPGAKRLIEMAQSGAVQCIIVKDLSRWGRNYIEVGDFLEQKFPAWGVRFISVGDNYDSDKLNHGAVGIDVAFRNLIYDLYSQDLSVKCRSGKDAATRNGKIVCTYPTFGYDKNPNDRHKFVIDPLEALVVKRIFDLAEQGYMVSAIAKILNDEKVPTKQMGKHRKGFTFKWGRGDAWDYSSVIDTLRNENYTGKWIYGKRRTVAVGVSKTKKIPREEWIIVNDAIPRLVTDEQFAAVQAKLNAAFKGNIKKVASTAPRTIFAKLVKCAKCGRYMDYSSRANSPGFFFCKMPKRSDSFGCKPDKIEESDLIAAVLTTLQMQIALTDCAKQRLKALPSVNMKNHLLNETGQLQKLIEQAKSTKITLWESYQCGKMTKEKFQRESEQITKQVTEYEKRQTELNEQLKSSSEHEDEEKVVERLVGLTGLQELSRELVLEFINEINIYSTDRIEIIWKYGDVFEKMLAASEI